MPPQDDYEVRLDAFQGPLDLLLFLVRRAEVDIHDIPIAKITDQYLGLLGQMDHIDIDQAGEFLVMAATLVEIKSRVIAPPQRDEDGAGEGSAESAGALSLEDADPRFDLVRQLVAYQRFRTAADLLERMRQSFAKRHAVGSHAIGGDQESGEEELAIELEDANVVDLLAAYERIVAAVDFSRLGEHKVEYDDTPISLHQEDLIDRVQRSPGGRMTLQQAFEGRSRSEMIGLFLALLELARQQRITVRQESASDPIEIEATATAAEPLATSTEVNHPAPDGAID
ncbi:MAG: hypothetical protein EXS00_08425 [Phycisphaerales bacterium]|nr:hypothetical protein [Phycisphaerales bacterium]